MGLNHIQLPAAIITDLYKNSLVEGNEAADTSKRVILNAPADDQKKYLGKNKKNILVVVDIEDAVYLPDDQLEFLTNMLSACKLSFADVALVNRNSYRGINYNEASEKFRSLYTFLFGVDPVSYGLPLSFPQFQIQSFAGAKYLFTPTLEECKNDSLLKSKLWVSLRHVFGI